MKGLIFIIICFLWMLHGPGKSFVPMVAAVTFISLFLLDLLRIQELIRYSNNKNELKFLKKKFDDLISAKTSSNNSSRNRSEILSEQINTNRSEFSDSIESLAQDIEERIEALKKLDHKNHSS